MIGVVYSKSQRIRRRLIISDKNIDLHKIIHPNEGWLDIPEDVYESGGLNSYIEKQIGPPLSDDCCVISAKGIELFIKADPTIDVHELGEIKHIDNVDKALITAKLEGLK